MNGDLQLENHGEGGTPKQVLTHEHEELESRVQERTAELIRANAALQAEIAQRRQADDQL